MHTHPLQCKRGGRSEGRKGRSLIGTFLNKVKDLLGLEKILRSAQEGSTSSLPTFLPTSLPTYFPSYQLFATASTMRASPTRSFRSITSAGECEYRSGHPIAASGTPYAAKVEPSFPPLVAPTWNGIPFARASATSESTSRVGVTDELSTARATGPRPIGASAKVGISSGESAETKVSIARTTAGESLRESATKRAPSSPTS